LDPNSRTVFTLALLPDSVSGYHPGMTRPVTIAVKDDKVVSLTSGGIGQDFADIEPGGIGYDKPSR
jgi:hypothetical protein